MVRRRRQVQQEEEQRVDHRPRHDDDAINNESESEEVPRVQDQGGYIFSDPKLESWGGKGATIKEARMFQLARNG